MNLALQTLRAVITLSLMALALVCIAAKTVTRADALSATVPARVENMAIETVQTSTHPVVIKTVAKTKMHAETHIIRI